MAEIKDMNNVFLKATEKSNRHEFLKPSEKEKAVYEFYYKYSGAKKIKIHTVDSELCRLTYNTIPQKCNVVQTSGPQKMKYRLVN